MPHTGSSLFSLLLSCLVHSVNVVYFLFFIFSSLLLSAFYCPAPCPLLVSLVCLSVCLHDDNIQERRRSRKHLKQQQLQ